MRALRAAQGVFRQHPVTGAVASAALTAVLTFVISHLVFYSSDHRAVLDARLTEVRDGAQEVQNSIVELVKVAKGEEAKPSTTVLQFRKNLVNLHQRAESLTGLLPETEKEFLAYKMSMKDLSESVKKMKGPLTAKEFVESVSSWQHARQRYDRKADDARNQLLFWPAVFND